MSIPFQSCSLPRAGVARRTLTEAVRWAAALQGALLQLDWPPAVLAWRDCAEAVSPVTQRFLWRGLRVRCGIAYGRPQFRKPLNTGAWGPAHALALFCAPCSFLRAPEHGCVGPLRMPSALFR